MRIHTPEHISCWNAYSRILYIMSVMEDLPELSGAETDSEVGKICEHSEEARQTMSLDEVVFWAGVATGLNLSWGVEAGQVDPEVRERVAGYAAMFAESTKSAVVEMTLRDLEG